MKRAGSVSKYFTRSGDRLWRYRFDADPVDGARTQISKAGYETRAAALDAMHDAVTEYKASKTLPAAEPVEETVADWIRIWLRDYSPHQCSAKTQERYAQLANYILGATEGEPAALAAMPLCKLKHNAVEAALYALLRMPAKRRKHLSPKSIREIGSVLSVALNEAFRLDKILVNPMLKVKLPKVEHTDARSLTPDEIQRLRNACRGDWSFMFIETALGTGARRGELLALEWNDIDWLTSTITIRRSLEQTVAAGLQVKRPKSGKTRTLQIGQTLTTSLRFLHEQQQENKRLLGSDYIGDLVFCEPGGEYLNPALVSQVIVRRIRKAGIADGSLHTLRHTHGSILLSKGVPLSAVSVRLGHSNPAITARIYMHALAADDARAVAAWETVADIIADTATIPIVTAKIQ